MEKFQHAVDRSAIPTVTILGVEIADINMPWLLRFTDEKIGRASCRERVCQYV